MGLFLCPVCDEHWTENHVCDRETIIKRVQRLEDERQTAERKLDDIRNGVFIVLHTLPSLESETVTIETEWLRRLWKAADCQWYEAKSADSFLVRWMATHRILCEAFDLFRSKKYGKTETLLQKLTHLREACDQAKEVLGYKNSNFDMTPKDVANAYANICTT